MHPHCGASLPGADLDSIADLMHDPKDRKSTRLNSSHGYISYAVFCLKKKNKYTQPNILGSKHSMGVHGCVPCRKLYNSTTNLHYMCEADSTYCELLVTHMPSQSDTL